MTAKRTLSLGHADQSGQALVLTMAFAAVSAVMVFFLFGTAQLANQKTKLQNTADAAAFSAGVLQARDYNFSAYTNRAMVANHVAMAQFVGLESWTEEISKEYKQDSCIPLVSKCFPAFVASFGSLMWNTPQTAANKLAQLSRSAFNVEKKIAVAIEPLIAALKIAQITYHVSTLGQFGVGAVDGVVKANDPDATVSRAAFNTAVTVKEIIDWKAFTKTLSTTNEKKRFANVTVDSMAEDGFSHSRGMVRASPWIPYSPVKPYICPGAAITFVNMEQVHGGGTQMSQDMTKWFAIDSAGVTGAWGCVWSIWPPIGFVDNIVSVWMDIHAHGGARAGSGGGYAFNGYSSPNTREWGYGQALGALVDPIAAIPGWVRYAKGPGNGLGAANYRGIRPYEDVSGYAKTPTNQMDPANVAPTLSIEVQKDGTKVHTAAQLLPGNSVLKLNDDLKGNVMRVVASSQAYFLRPRRADHRLRLDASFGRDDGKTEYASLMNPYWQARLVETPAANVALSTASQ